MYGSKIFVDVLGSAFVISAMEYKSPTPSLQSDNTPFVRLSGNRSCISSGENGQCPTFRYVGSGNNASQVHYKTALLVE